MKIRHIADKTHAGVSVGGVGGSGTRLVALILQSLGYRMGSHLGPALDDLCFTFLMRQPAWSGENFPGEDEIRYCLELFSRVLTTDEVDALNQHDQHYLSDLLKAWKKETNVVRYQEFVACVDEISQPGLKPTQNGSWAWKEPNTHIFLQAIHQQFPGTRYIHVIRNGLDMVFSKNQNQTKRWAACFGIRVNGDHPTQAQSLAYWIRANRRAIADGNALPDGSFLLLNYDKLCNDPEAEIPKLIGFLDLEVDSDQLQRLTGLVSPSTLGRYKQRDLNVFSENQLNAVAQLGFSVASR